ncbi:MAG: pyridoxal-phosphate dependent enzyme [Candidatus Eisenbacteria bacterium]|uniref:Pyridoxal-phosphate dependent enzyme n=1 Tax=Eiseniibacteriota bacterium TaxID=2212470 RepID=A0A933SAZ9_UNCEI|nr:pyridoxal-phosphate dependent enzyme [Candidatus Eisenbacteria bacterium]
MLFEPLTALRCIACGAEPDARDPYPFRCPHAGSGDGREHLLTSSPDMTRARFALGTSGQPFVRHRELLHSYTRARTLGMSDAAFVDMVEELDAKVAAVEGHGFAQTPLAPSEALAKSTRLTEGEVWVKNETSNVAGSHKARHLFALALHLEVSERTGLTTREETNRRGLAIASCGNAALAAAVVARATERPLEVFIPPDADPRVVERLRALGATIGVCVRQEGVSGDPCVRAFHAALAKGALPFCVQGNENGLNVEGGATIGWELASQLASSGGRVDRVFMQVGGGALASGVIQGLRHAREQGVIEALPKLHTVQTRGCWPLRRAYERLRERALPGAHGDDPTFAVRLRAPNHAGDVRTALLHALDQRARYMWAWELAPHSIAHGILDDETYDWFAIVEGMLESGGWPVVVDEALLAEARDMAQAAGVRADATGAASLAGLLALRRVRWLGVDERVVVLLTGVQR